MGKIEKNWKFNGQLRVNLHKFKIKDQSEKALKSRADIEVQQEQNYIKLKVDGQLGVQLK
jgi:hypothetical protein